MSTAGRPLSTARSEVGGSLAVVLAAACWGTSPIFIKLITGTGVTAFALAFWRDVVTFAVLLLGFVLPIALGLGGRGRRKGLVARRADLGWLVAMGLSLGAFHITWNLDVQLQGASVATMQQAAMPAIVALAAWLLWREPLTWRKIAAIAVTFGGTALVSGLEVLGQIKFSPAGLLLGLAMPTFYACWTLAGKAVRDRYNPFVSLTYAFGIASLAQLPIQPFTAQPWPVAPTVMAWFAAMVLVSTIGGFGLYTFALGYLQASVASIVVMTEIAFVVVYAYVLLGERLVPTQIVGALLVVGGVMLLSWQTWRRGGKTAW